MTAAVDDEVTHDTLLRGQIKLIQPLRGFRSSLDPVLLAAFSEPPYGRFLDIGSGTGALSFLLLARDPAAQGVGAELQDRLAALATLATAENHFEARYRVMSGDARRTVRALPAGSFDLVATNPPFRPLGTGVLPADREKGIAHHEVALTLVEWIGLAAHALRPEGRLVVIFPAQRVVELCAGLTARGLSPTRLRAVHPQAGQPAQRILVEAQRGSSRAARTVDPLITHQDGGFSAEVLAMLAGKTP